MWRIINGVVHDVTIAPNVVAAIGDGGVSIVCGRYSNLIHAPVAMNVDSNGNVRVYGQREPEGMPLASTKGAALNKPSTGSKGVNSQAKLPRPPNSFILYRQHHHPLIKSKEPWLHNNQISSILGKQWKNESEEVKDKFRKLADEMKQRHFRDHPDYQYRPRKPSEKKRRMTRRKALASTAKTSASQATSATHMTGPASNQTSLTPQRDEASSTDFSLFEFPPLPEIPMTPQGNGILTLGSEDYESMDLDQMITAFNQQFSAAAANVPSFNTPVLYHELSSDAQDDLNFSAGATTFSQAQDMLNEASMAAEMVLNSDGPTNTWEAALPADQTTQFDANFSFADNKEWMRQYTNGRK